MSDHNFETQSPDLSQSIAGYFRAVCQLVGLVLVLIGCSYGMGIVTEVIGFLRNPENLKQPAAAMAVAVGLDKTVVSLGEEKVQAGPTLGMTFLIGWYFLVTLILWGLVGVGGKLMIAAIGERREFYAATKEMMMAIRREQEMKK